jgi:hypothetical protein
MEAEQMKAAWRPVSRFLGFAVALLPSWFLLSGCGANEPRFQGRPASYWLEQMKHGDEMARVRAAAALGQLGPDIKGAVPLLHEGLHDSSPLVRWSAAAALSRYGAKAKVAVPDLREMMNKDESPIVRRTARETLSRIER